MLRAIEYVDHAADESEASAMLGFLAIQVDYLGGRILAPSPANPTWRVQALFEGAPDVAWLPDGCRHVVLPRSVARRFNITA